MLKLLPMINLKKVKRYSIKVRLSKVNKGDFALKPAKARSFSSFLNSLPNILKANFTRANPIDLPNHDDLLSEYTGPRNSRP